MSFPRAPSDIQICKVADSISEWCATSEQYFSLTGQHCKDRNVVAKFGNVRVRYVSRDHYIYDAGRAHFVD